MILIQRKFLFLTLLYSGLLAFHLPTSANAMDEQEKDGKKGIIRPQQMDRSSRAPAKPSSNNSFLSCCCDDEEEKKGFKPLPDEAFSPQKKKSKNIEAAPIEAAPAPAPRTQPSVEITALPRKVSFEVGEDLEVGVTDHQDSSSFQVVEDVGALSRSFLIQESGDSSIQELALKDLITQLLNRQTPSRVDVSLINVAGNNLGNAEFCTYTFGTEPKLPSAKGNTLITPVLDNEPFSEKMINKTSSSINRLQIEDTAWIYAQHFFAEIKKKQDEKVKFSYYGYKLPERLAFARLITPTIVYDLTLPRKEGVGSVATHRTKSSVSSKKNGQVN